jgi:hypothetical protein
MAGIGKQFKGSGIAKSGFSSKHEQARDHLKSGGLTPIGNLRIPRRVKGELNMLAEGGKARKHYEYGSDREGVQPNQKEDFNKKLEEGRSIIKNQKEDFNKKLEEGRSIIKNQKEDFNKKLEEGRLIKKEQGYKKGGSANWIKSAIKHPGALRASLHVKAGEKIPAKKLSAAAKKPGTLGRRARLAQTLRGFKK